MYCTNQSTKQPSEQTNRRTDRGGGNAVLAGARLGDDAPLAQPLGEQRLPHRVVDLVRARVRQLLAAGGVCVCFLVRKDRCQSTRSTHPATTN